MATPVYVVSVLKANEAYYDLCDRKEDHQAWFAELGEAAKQASGETILWMYSLNPRAYAISVVKYPDMETCVKAQVIQKTKRVMRYFDVESYTGYVRDDWVPMAKALGVFHTNAPEQG